MVFNGYNYWFWAWARYYMGNNSSEVSANQANVEAVLVEKMTHNLRKGLQEFEDREQAYKIMAARLRWWATAIEKDWEHRDEARNCLDWSTGYNPEFRGDQIELYARVKITQASRYLKEPIYSKLVG